MRATISSVGVSLHQMQNSAATPCDILYGKKLAATSKLLTRTTPFEQRQLWERSFLSVILCH